jgi:predicted dehydrogenase
LLERSAIIVVESAVRDHARDALLALQAGKHVHVEKPPASSLREVQEMVSLAQGRHLVLQMGYMWRYHPGFLAVFEAAQKGWLGEIFLVRGAISNFLAPARRPQWGEFKGGSMFDLGSHLIDAAARLLGKPQKVTAFLHRHGQATDQLNDNNVAVLEYDKAQAVITNTALQRTETPQRSFEVLGSNGSALLSPIEPPELQFEFVKAAGPYHKGTQIVGLPEYRRHAADFAALAAAVRGQSALSVTPEEELAVQETLLKACGMM